MKTLFAIISCHKFDYRLSDNFNAERFQASNIVNRRVNRVRTTWLPTLKQLLPDCTVVFFYGSGPTRKPESDEIFLDCPDDYFSVFEKVKAIVRYALENGYDFLVKCDDDCTLTEEAILSLNDSPDADYMGMPVPTIGNMALDENLCVDIHQIKKALTYRDGFACGNCYRLSRRAMEIIDQTQITRRRATSSGRITDQVPLEDELVGQILHSHSHRVAILPNFKLAGYVESPDSELNAVERLYEHQRYSVLSDFGKIRDLAAVISYSRIPNFSRCKELKAISQR